jgi:hypothetical protein
MKHGKFAFMQNQQPQQCPIHLKEMHTMSNNKFKVGRENTADIELY